MTKRGPAGRPRAGRRQRRIARQRQAQSQRYIWLGAIGLAFAGLIALGIYRATTAPAIGESIASSNRIGPVSAPVQIVEFGDFGCPACRTVHNLGIVDALLERYGEQVSFTFRHFPVITSQSPLAAQASQCAGEQGAFWAWHDYMYEVVPPGSLAEPDLRLHAAALGLEATRFNHCLDEGVYEEYVALDQRAALTAGARGTPSFFINGQAISPDLALMSATIDRILGH